jgi:PAS domain S-box-containing protein
MENYREELSRILNLLRGHPRGLTITELARQLEINRNSVAKYLDVLVTSGHIESKTVGPAKVFFISHRVPLSAMLNLSSDMILVLDDRTRVLYVNDRLLEFEGRTRSDIVGQGVRELGLQLLSDPAILPSIEVPRQAEEARDITVRKGDLNYSFHVLLTPSTFEDGSSGITIRAEDRTEEVTNRKTLEISEARYRAVVEDQTEGIIRFNPDGIFTFTNDAFCRFVDRTREQVLGSNVTYFIPDEDIARIRETYRSLTPDHPSMVLEFRAKRSDGTVRWIQADFRGFFDDRGAPIEYQAVSRDVTDLKAAERAIQESEARYRAVVEDQTEMICRFLPDGIHVFVNEAYCRYFGKKREDLIGHRFIPRIPDEDRPKVAAHLASLTREHPVDAIEHRIVMPDGDVRWQRWIDRVILDNQGRIVEYQSVGRDITPRKRVEEDLRHQTFQLRERVKELRCLLDISRLMETAEADLPTILASIARFLPTAMQFPDLAVARIVLDGREYSSGPPGATPWEIHREIHVHGQTAGTVGLSYTAQPPVPDAEVFLIEEKALVGAVAERLGRIAERLGAEGALQEQMHLIRELLDRIPVPVFYKDSDRVYMGCNRAFEQFSQLSRDQIIGHTVSEVWPTQLAAHYDSIERQVLSSGGAHRDEMDYPAEGGGVRNLVFNRAPFFGTDGAIRGLVATIIEVTDQKTAEKALRASEEQFREMAENSPFPIALINGDGRYRYVNRKFTHVFGYTLDDVPTGRRWFEQAFTDPELRRKAIAAWQEDLAASAPGMVRPRQFPVRCRNGECREVIFRPVTLRDGSQYITYEDVTERLRAMDSLQMSETRYQHLFNTMRCCFTLVQPVLDARGMQVDLTFLEVNAAMERLTGRTREDLLGMNLRELYPDTPQELMDMAGAVALTGDPKKIVIYHPDFQKNLKIRAYSPWKGQCAIIFRAVLPEKEQETPGREPVSPNPG